MHRPKQLFLLLNGLELVEVDVHVGVDLLCFEELLVPFILRKRLNGGAMARALRLVAHLHNGGPVRHSAGRAARLHQIRRDDMLHLNLVRGLPGVQHLSFVETLGVIIEPDLQARRHSVILRLVWICVE